MERPGAGNVAAECIPEVLTRVAVKSRFAAQKVMASDMSSLGLTMDLGGLE
jgi:hypothetical protein